MRNAIDLLTEHGIRPSPQRVAIMDYLLCHKTHPTVDNVYAAMLPNMPTLSKTTVYNTLKILEEKGAIQVLNIDEKNAHYDAEETIHAHFLCQNCNKIFDIFFDKDRQEHIAGLTKTSNLKPFSITSTQINYKGICPDCLKEKNSK